MSKIAIVSGTALLLSMFNVYTSNVITGYNSDNFSYCYDDSADCKLKKELRKKVENYRHMLLLLFGILCIIVSFFVNHSTVRLSLLVAGIFTIVYAVLGNWDNYNDISKMLITGFGTICIIVLVVYYGDKYMIKE